ncbi:hypothetical protein [Nocardioides nematodiphilus]|uniref:hypothetical protein n=1 Tax=Nocardioides nematodiphilus TaxID=2849669 RepID=UPI001CD94E11|nr:hypothetical protein [Nocardioides nematodiphilus]MCA1984751.1 hypothetical protein [Nocardioides nematodiphilus]
MRTWVALLPEAWLHSHTFVIASTFVAVNTLVYLALAVVKVMPVVLPARWLPHHYHRAESRAIDAGVGDDPSASSPEITQL